MRTLLHPRRRLSWRPIRGATWSVIRHGFAPNGSPCGSEDREGASDSVPVLRQGRGERWLGCCCSQPLVPSASGSRLSAMEASGRNFLFYVAASLRCSHFGNRDIAFAFVSFSPVGVWVLPVEYVSGRVRWTNFSICSVAVNSNPEAFAQSMLLVAVFFSAIRTWTWTLFLQVLLFWQFAAVFAAQCSIFRGPR